MDIPDVITNDIGPLPAWGWAVVGVAGISLGRLARNATSGASGGETGDSGSYSSGIGSTSGAVNLPQAAQPYADTSTTVTTNDEWRSKAVGWLTGQGYEPLLAERAVTDYLAGRQLGADTSGALNAVLGVIGIPPAPPNEIAAVAADPGEPAPGADTIYDSDPYAQDVRAAYRKYLGREPDAIGLDYWRARIAPGGDIKAKDLAKHFSDAAKTEQTALAQQ